MALQVAVFLLKSFVSADSLLVKGFDVGRQKPLQAKFCALFLGECGAFVQGRRVEQIHATRNVQNIFMRDRQFGSHFVSFPIKRLGIAPRSRLTFARSIGSSPQPAPSCICNFPAMKFAGTNRASSTSSRSSFLRLRDNADDT